MGNVVISVENLSKSYRLGQIGTGTFANDLQIWWARARGKPNPLLRLGHTDYSNRAGEEIWALRDINFTVEQGEVLGIIGRNGAGKSTLLKILSRVTAPTTGLMKVKGRIVSLLEVGTGFHPDLTGRENIYLNGAILGMRRTEVRKKLDEIAAFAEIAQFLDTPVKRYSSGMYVRLAFAVAAHLNSDILVVDEVLAVGDLAFQKKCLGKMSEVSKGGRTILFVSHNLASVKTLCDIGFVLDKGLMVYGPNNISTVLDFYNKMILDYVSSNSLESRKDRKGNSDIRIVGYEILNETGSKMNYITCGDFVRIRLHYKCQKEFPKISVAISLGASVGDNKLLLWSESKDFFYSSKIGEGYFDCVVPKFPLTPGSYLLNMYISSGNEVLDWMREMGYIDVINGDFFKSNRIPIYKQQTALIDHYWE